MSPPLAKSPLEAFRRDVAHAELSEAASRTEWAVREADLDRRLTALLERTLRLSKRSEARSPPGRDPVALYASRWCHLARSSLRSRRRALPPGESIPGPMAGILLADDRHAVHSRLVDHFVEKA